MPGSVIVGGARTPIGKLEQDDVAALAHEREGLCGGSGQGEALLLRVTA